MTDKLSQTRVDQKPNPKRRFQLSLLDKALGLLTALLLLAGAYLTYKSDKLTSERNDAQSKVSSQRSSIASLNTTNANLQNTNASLASATASLKSQLASPSGSTIPAQAPTVRHQDNDLVLAVGGAQYNLDAPSTDKQWTTSIDQTNSDLAYDSNNGLTFNYDDVLVLPAGSPPGYDTCSSTTGYAQNTISLSDLHAGEGICVETDGHRYSALRVRSASSARVVIAAVTYDPPFK